MSRYTHFQFRGEREGRVAQMSKQEQVIARKKQELLEKQKTTELAKQVAAAQNLSAKTDQPTEDSDEPVNKTVEMDSQSALLKNSFYNDGSFLENFKKITEAAAKKAEEERLKQELEDAEKEKESETNTENKEHQSRLVIFISMLNLFKLIKYLFSSIAIRIKIVTIKSEIKIHNVKNIICIIFLIMPAIYHRY